MTLGELRAATEPAEVRASRRVAIRQRERDRAELGYRDLGGESG